MRRWLHRLDQTSFYDGQNTNSENAYEERYIRKEGTHRTRWMEVLYTNCSLIRGFTCASNNSLIISASFEFSIAPTTVDPSVVWLCCRYWTGCVKISWRLELTPSSTLLTPILSSTRPQPSLTSCRSLTSLVYLSSCGLLTWLDYHRLV